MVGKRGVEFALPVAVQRKADAGPGLTRGLQLQHLGRQVGHRPLGRSLLLRPPLAADLGQPRPALAAPDVFLDQPDLGCRYKDLRPLGKLDHQVLFHQVFAFQDLRAAVAADAMSQVDDQVPPPQLGKAVDRATQATMTGPMDLLPQEKFTAADDHHVGREDAKTGLQAAHVQFHPPLAGRRRIPQNLTHPLDLGRRQADHVNLALQTQPVQLVPHPAHLAAKPLHRLDRQRTAKVRPRRRHRLGRQGGKATDPLHHRGLAEMILRLFGPLQVVARLLALTSRFQQQPPGVPRQIIGQVAGGGPVGLQDRELDGVQLSRASLSRHVKAADRFQVVAAQFDPDRGEPVRGKDVEDATPRGHFARQLDGTRPVQPTLHQPSDQRVDVDLLAHLQAAGGCLQRTLVADRLQQALNAGHYDLRPLVSLLSLPACQPFQHPQPLPKYLVVHHPLARIGFPGRKRGDRFGAEQRKLGGKIVDLTRLRADHDQRARRRRTDRGRHQRAGRPPDPVQRAARAGLQRGQQVGEVAMPPQPISQVGQRWGGRRRPVVTRHGKGQSRRYRRRCPIPRTGFNFRFALLCRDESCGWRDPLTTLVGGLTSGHLMTASGVTRISDQLHDQRREVFVWQGGRRDLIASGLSIRSTANGNV